MNRKSLAVVEHVELTIQAGREAEFEEAFAVGHAAICQASGYQWARLSRQVESPSVYLLLVGWETLEAHTEEFRASENFTRWRAAVGDFFAEPPRLTHYTAAAVAGDGEPWGGREARSGRESGTKPG